MSKIKLPNIEMDAEELRQLLAEHDHPKRRRAKPAHDKTYYYLTESCINTGIWVDSYIDNARLERGNVYLTTEDAVKADRQRIAETEVLDALYEADLHRRCCPESCPATCPRWSYHRSYRIEP